MELPVPRTTAAAAAAAAIGPYAVRGIAGKEGTGTSGALWLHGKPPERNLHLLLQNTGLTHTYRLSAPQRTLKDDNREIHSPEFISSFAQLMARGMPETPSVKPTPQSSQRRGVEALNEKQAISDLSCH